MSATVLPGPRAARPAGPRPQVCRRRDLADRRINQNRDARAAASGAAVSQQRRRGELTTCRGRNRPGSASNLRAAPPLPGAGLVEPGSSSLRPRRWRFSMPDQIDARHDSDRQKEVVLAVSASWTTPPDHLFARLEGAQEALVRGVLATKRRRPRPARSRSPCGSPPACGRRCRSRPPPARSAAPRSRDAAGRRSSTG